MSDPDNFLSRWSRRKLESAQESAQETKHETEALPEQQPAAAPSERMAPSEPEAAKAPNEEPPFDLSELPPIESITANTDIRDFLRPGVPLSLSRAALRAAWSSDPAIRDFIGIAENQWDFTDHSIPGFGPIDPADAQRLFAQMTGVAKDAIEAADKLADGAQSVERPSEPDASNQQIASVNTAEDSVSAQAPAPSQDRVQDLPHREQENDAVQNEDTARDFAQPRHGHGSALPT